MGGRKFGNLVLEIGSFLLREIAMPYPKLSGSPGKEGAAAPFILFFFKLSPHKNVSFPLPHFQDPCPHSLFAAPFQLRSPMEAESVAGLGGQASLHPHRVGEDPLLAPALPDPEQAGPALAARFQEVAL